MKITVLTTVYNAPEQILREAINSILNQSHEDFEYVIVDDHSTAETVEVLKSIKDSRIRLIEMTENRGGGMALNIGVRHSTGDVIIKMDNDDIAHTDLVKCHLKNFSDHPEIKICGVQLRAFGSSDLVTHHPLIVTPKIAYEDQHFWIVNHPGIAYYKSLIVEAGCYNIARENNYPIDYELWIKLLSKGITIYNLPDVLMNYRMWEHSTSIKRKENNHNYMNILQGLRNELHRIA